MNTHCLTYRSVLFFLFAALFILSSANVNAAGLDKAPLFAHLLGGNEVDSTTGAANAGDPAGFGSATVILKGATTLCFAILMSNLETPTAAHIHEAPAGVNGGVDVTLSVPATGNPGAASGCITVDSAKVTDIRNNPSKHYINIHTTGFPGGAIRGQLF
jgi:hypothetical protein